MAKIEVRLTAATPEHDWVDGEDVIAEAEGTVEVTTPAGQVYITYDERIGAVIMVRGEKATTTVKFNEKAVV